MFGFVEGDGGPAWGDMEMEAKIDREKRWKKLTKPALKDMRGTYMDPQGAGRMGPRRNKIFYPPIFAAKEERVNGWKGLY